LATAKKNRLLHLGKFLAIDNYQIGTRYNVNSTRIRSIEYAKILRIKSQRKKKFTRILQKSTKSLRTQSVEKSIFENDELYGSLN